MPPDDPVAHQDKRDIQDKRSHTDGQPPEMVYDKGEAGEPSRGKVCKLGKRIDPDGKKDIADDVADPVQTDIPCVRF